MPATLLLLSLSFAADPEPPAWDVQAPHGPGADVRFTVNEGTWLSVDVSPDGSSVLFDLLGDLYVVPLAGGPAKRLTTGVAWDTDAKWSPDGERIVFSSDRGGNENLWVMGKDGADPEPVTEEQVDRWTDPVWAPEPGWFLARRRSIDTRSIGVTELWMVHAEGGGGVRLTALADDPHAGEAAFSPDGRHVYFSTRAGRFEYDHNPHQGLWQVARYDRVKGELVRMTAAGGSAVRPTPSPDGRTLAFVTRDRERSRLVLLDLQTGAVRRLDAPVEHDQMEGFALRGVYPRMDWTPDGRELVYWQGGKLWRLDVASGGRVEVPFTAEVQTRITEAVRPPRRVEEGPVHARVVRWPVLTPSGEVYAAAVGRVWHLDKDGAATAVSPDAVSAGFPTLSPDRATLAYTTWDDEQGGQVLAQKAGPRPGKPRVVAAGPQFESPAFSPDGRALAVLRGTGAPARGHDLGAELSYELVVLPVAGGAPTLVTRVPFRGSNAPAPRPQWAPDGRRLYWLEDEPGEPRKPENTVLVSTTLDGTDRRVHLRLPGAWHIRLSPDHRHVVVETANQAWVAPLPALGGKTIEWADLPSRRLTKSGGDWVDWVDAATVSWSHGDTVYRIGVAGLVERGAKELPPATARALSIEVPRLVGTETVAFTNARIVPVEGPPVPRGTLVVRGRRIAAVGADVPVPAGARVIDLAGRTVLPGMVDVHAHLHYASGDTLPEQEWRHLANLAYGVTTVFDPSASTDLAFGQAELIEAGRMSGPRVHSTGFILYGALSTLGTSLGSKDDAEHAVRRLQQMGAIGIKSYQQAHRTHRQWLVEACRALGLLNVPEGGGDWMMNLGMVIDGHSSVEHAIPVAPLYDDVVQLWSRAKTVYVPTLLVAYGGPTGEREPFAAERVWQDERLARFVPPEELTSRGYRLDLVVTDPRELHHHEVARGAAKLRRAGVTVALGAHGQLQGLGPHWEMEALAVEGAMTPAEALEAATLAGARHLGLDRDLGSLTVGKVADLFVVDGDPLTDLRAAREVVWVMKDGILYEARTMDRVSPDPRPRPALLWERQR